MALRIFEETLRTIGFVTIMCAVLFLFARWTAYFEGQPFWPPFC
jgi:hypothetical protein